MTRMWMIAVLGAWIGGCGGRRTPGGAVGVPEEPQPEPAPPPAFVDLTLSSLEEEEIDMAFLFREEADCGDLVSLEPSALLGRLTEEEILCLEDSLAESARQTFRRKVSLLLMADAFAKGDAHRWETVARRHLQTIDQSDPDLCYKFARHLARRGPEKAQEVLHWADVALENRTRFPPGDTTVSRVYALLKLKAVASARYWELLERRFAEAPSDELDEEREEARNEAKILAREWLEFAREAGRDDTVAYTLCVAAAGAAAYCATD